MEKFRSPKAIWIENKPQGYHACTNKPFVSNFLPNLYVEIATIYK
jgi:hypothetical protein